MHYFYDGYGIAKNLLNSPKVLSLLSGTMVAQYFDRQSSFEMRMIAADQAAFPNIADKNEGLSVVVLGNGKHFTCHTYPRRGIAFADLLLPSGVVADFHNQMQAVLRAEYYDDGTRGTNPGKYGKHVIMKFDTCWRFEEALQIVDNIRVTLDMTKLSDMLTNRVASSYDILQPIVESHIALHADKVKQEMVLDIFSCRDFEEKIIQETLQPASVRLVQRGIDFE